MANPCADRVIYVCYTCLDTKQLPTWKPIHKDSPAYTFDKWVPCPYCPGTHKERQ